MRRFGRLLVGALASATLIATLVAGPAAAANSVTVHIGCPGGNGNVGKLVQAVRDANTRAPKTTVIYLATSCSYDFYRAHSFPVDGVRANALPVVRSHIVIHGQGATLSRHHGAHRFRFFAVDTTGNLSMDHLTLTGGGARHGLSGASHLGTQGDDATAGRDGGAIYSVGKVTLDYVTLDHNTAGNGGNGGGSNGLDADDGDDANHVSGGNAGAGGRGGAIYSEGTLTVTNSVLSNNRAGNGGTGGLALGGNGGNATTPGGNGGNGGSAAGGNGGPGGYGGAIYSSGALTVSNSTLSDNGTGNGGGGGIASGGRGGDGADGTPNGGAGGDGGSSNTLSASGGTGTAVYQWGGHADILNDTVTNNVGGDGGSTTSTGGNGGDGGDCEGAAGSGGPAGAGSGNAGTDPLRADNGATLDTTGTTLSGNTDGVAGSSSNVGGSNGSIGASCT